MIGQNAIQSRSRQAERECALRRLAPEVPKVYTCPRICYDSGVIRRQRSDPQVTRLVVAVHLLLVFLLVGSAALCIDAAKVKSVERFAGGASPDTEKVLLFSGYEWNIRRSDQPVSPGPNYFSDSTENVWVDQSDRLHLRVTERDGVWYCAEVNLRGHLGYGTYVFKVEGMIGALDRNVVLGMFNYDSDTSAEYHREFDIEFSMWGRAVSPNAEYVVQPWTVEGNIFRWEMPVDIDSSTHSYHWTGDSIFFLSGRGHQSFPPFDSVLGQWTYTKRSGIPEPGCERVTLNLWLFEAEAPSDGVEPEVVFRDFRHFSPFWVHEYDATSRIRLWQNEPNPFRAKTALRFETSASEDVSLAVFDVAGRRIRGLTSGLEPAGLHQASWDGLDDSGSTVPAGIYFCRLEAGEARAAISMILTR